MTVLDNRGTSFDLSLILWISATSVTAPVLRLFVTHTNVFYNSWCEEYLNSKSSEIVTCLDNVPEQSKVASIMDSEKYMSNTALCT
jgi:hypothetical protein